MSHKHPILLSAILGVVLNLGLMLLPSVVLGIPDRILMDPRFVVFLVIVSIWVLLEATGAPQSEFYNLQTQARWLPNLMSAAMLLVLLASLSERALHAVTPFTVPAMIGTVLLIVGILLRYIAIRALGVYFLDDVAVVSGQPLVTTGIYSYVRHPSETGNLCIAFGSPLLLGSGVGLGITICVLLPIVLIRILYEDRLLMHHYPDSFRVYMRDVPALIPRRLRRIDDHA